MFRKLLSLMLQASINVLRVVYTIEIDLLYKTVNEFKYIQREKD